MSLFSKDADEDLMRTRGSERAIGRETDRGNKQERDCVLKLQKLPEGYFFSISNTYPAEFTAFVRQPLLLNRETTHVGSL